MPAPPLHFELGGRALVFAEASPGRYSAELDSPIDVVIHRADQNDSYY